MSPISQTSFLTGTFCHFLQKSGFNLGLVQKYIRLRCLVRVKGLVICFYLGWSGSILQKSKPI